MKMIIKYIALAIIALFLNVSTFSQTGQSNDMDNGTESNDRKVRFAVGGALDLSYSNNINDYSETKRTNLGFSPSFAVIIKNRHELGEGFSVNRYKYVRNDDFMPGEHEYISNSMNAYIYYRYYFSNKPLKPYINPLLSVGFGKSKSDGEDASDFFFIGSSFSLGCTYQLANNFELTMSIAALSVAIITENDYYASSAPEQSGYVMLQTMFDTQEVSMGIRYLF